MIGNKRVVATIEGRMTSTRLPGKILMPLCGKPVMQHMIERHRRSKFTDEVVVATTVNATDDPVVRLCEEIGCPYFRGSEEDVLGRIVGAGAEHNADILVQGMADSPLVDWRIVDELIHMLDEGGYDVTSNEFDSDKYPDGFDMRVYRFPLLQAVEKENATSEYREHAGYEIRCGKGNYTRGLLHATGDMLWPELRLTLDTQEDYQLISAVYDALWSQNEDFSADDVMQFLKLHPELVAINSSVVQKKVST